MKHKIIILALIILSIFYLKALLYPGFYTSHDGEHQIIRLMHFHQGLMDGQFPVRWAGTALEGNGYPLFIFTYRLPFWIAEGWYLLSGNLTDSIKFAFIFSYAASALTMYWFLVRLTKSRLSAVVGTLVYQIAPYRFLDIFVRAALGEAFTFVFIPLIFLGMYELAKDKLRWQWIVVTAVGFSGLMLSHIMTFFIFLPAIGLWFTLHLWLSSKRLKYVVSITTSTLMTLSLCAYYWLPALLEKPSTRFSEILGAYYEDHFVSLGQLIYSRWLFGFDKLGTENDMISFQIGFAQWIALLASLVYIILYLLQKKLRLVQGFTSKLTSWTLVGYDTFVLITSSIGILLMLPLSAAIYKQFNSIMAIDLPWKFIGVVVFMSSIAAALHTAKLRTKRVKYAFIVPIIALLLYGNRNHLRVNEYTYKSDSEYWSSTSTSNQIDEYAPKGYTHIRDNNNRKITIEKGSADLTVVKRGGNEAEYLVNVTSQEAEILTGIINYPQWKTKIDDELVETEDIHGNIMVRVPRGRHTARLEFADAQLLSYKGQSENTLIKRTSNSLSFFSKVTTPKVKVLTKIAYYPGWELYVDGIKQNIDTIQGRILVYLDEGDHAVTLQFQDTPIRKMANFISLTTLLFLITFTVWKKQRSS